MFCCRPADKVGDCVTSDTRCNRGCNKEVFCENITWIEMFPYSISMFAQQLISVNSYNTLSIAGTQCQQGKTAKPHFSLCHTVVKNRSETPSFYFLDHDVLGGGVCILGDSVIYPTLVLRSKSVAGPGVTKRYCTCGTGQMWQSFRKTEGLGPHLLSILTTSLVQHEQAAGCRYCAPDHFIDDVVTKCSRGPRFIYSPDLLRIYRQGGGSEKGSLLV